MLTRVLNSILNRWSVDFYIHLTERKLHLLSEPLIATTKYPQIVEFDSAGVYGGIKTGMELEPSDKFSQVFIETH